MEHESQRQVYCCTQSIVNMEKNPHEMKNNDETPNEAQRRKRDAS
jgi:hypothetical protein